MVQGHICKLLAALEPVSTWRGNMTYKNNSIKIHLHTNGTKFIQACVRFPFLLLKGSVTWHPENRSLNCTSECQLFTCINSPLTLNSSSQSLYLLHGWTELWLPVKLTCSWSICWSNSIIPVTDLTHRATSFVGTLITSFRTYSYHFYSSTCRSSFTRKSSESRFWTKLALQFSFIMATTTWYWYSKP